MDSCKVFVKQTLHDTYVFLVNLSLRGLVVHPLAGSVMRAIFVASVASPSLASL